MNIINGRVVYPRGEVNNHIYLFTANSTINQKGCLVMGAGNAKQVRDTYRGIDKQFGKVIEDQEVFGVKFVEHDKQWIGAFQTKINWRDPSPLDVVKYSSDHLKYFADRRSSWQFHLPCPAISHGKRRVDEILPLLEQLPDNVIIYIDK